MIDVNAIVGVTGIFALGVGHTRRKTIEPLLWMRAPDVRSGRFSINCRAIFVPAVGA